MRSQVPQALSIEVEYRNQAWFRISAMRTVRRDPRDEIYGRDTSAVDATCKPRAYGNTGSI